MTQAHAAASPAVQLSSPRWPGLLLLIAAIIELMSGLPRTPVA